MKYEKDMALGLVGGEGKWGLGRSPSGGVRAARSLEVQAAWTG